MEVADVGHKEPALFLASKIATHLCFFLLSDWPIFIDLSFKFAIACSAFAVSSSVTMLFSSQIRMPARFFSVTCLCGTSLFVESLLSCSTFSYLTFLKLNL